MNPFTRIRQMQWRPRGRSRKLRLLGITAGLIMLVLVSAHTVPIPMNGIAPLAGVRGVPPGKVVNRAVRPFVIRNSHGVVVANGVLDDLVWQEAATGDLDFYQQVVAAPGALPVTEVSLFNYPGLPFLNSDFLIGPAGWIPPNIAVRTSNEVVFEFPLPPAAHPAQTSDWFFVDTLALNFWPGGITVLQTPDGSSVMLNTFAPM